MLSRTAASLYWMGRYVERADFTARLIEATMRLDTLSSRPAGEVAWTSALTVIEADATFEALGKARTQANVAPFLAVSMDHSGSIIRCLEAARRNARVVRTALSREAWSAINRAWLYVSRAKSPANSQALFGFIDQVHADTQSFAGACARMLSHPSGMFIHLGAAIERADNTARLLDVKYHILLPEDEPVGGVVDRDQWTTMLQTVSAVNAYRLLYRDGLNPVHIIEFLTLRQELPRSLIACAAEVVRQLGDIAQVTDYFSEADSMAMTRLANLKRQSVAQIIGEGLHEYLEDFMVQNAALDEAIGRQFRFN